MDRLYQLINNHMRLSIDERRNQLDSLIRDIKLYFILSDNDTINEYRQGILSIDLISIYWICINKDKQIEYEDVFKEIVEANIEDDIITLIWENTSQELQTKYMDYIVKNVADWYLEDIWKYTKPKVQIMFEDYFWDFISKLEFEQEFREAFEACTEEFISFLVNDEHFFNHLKNIFNVNETTNNNEKYCSAFAVIWERMSLNQQIKNKNVFLDTLKYKEFDFELIEVFEVCTEEFLQYLANDEKTINYLKNVFNVNESTCINKMFCAAFSIVWERMSLDQQIKNKNAFFDVLEYQYNNFIEENIWKKTNSQEEFWEEVYNQFKNSIDLLLLIWDDANSNIQKTKIDEMFKEYSEFKYQFFRMSKPEVQEEKFVELEEQVKNDINKRMYLFSILQPELQEKYKETINRFIDESIKNDFEDFLDFWFRLSIERQRERFNELWHIIDQENNEEKLIEFFEATNFYLREEKSLEVFSFYKKNKRLFIILINKFPRIEENIDEIFDLCDEDIEMEIECYSRLFEGKKEKEKFEYLYKRILQLNDVKLYVYFWGKIDNRFRFLQEERVWVLEDILKRTDLDIEDITKILQNTKKEILTEEMLNKIIKSVFSKDEDIEKITSRLIFLKKLNSNICQTINLEFLCNDIVNNFNTEQLLRITVDAGLQEKIAKNIENAAFKSLLEYLILNSENLVFELNGICNNLEEYKELLNSLSKNNLGENEIKQLINCISNSKNYFNVEKIGDLIKFSENKKTMCQKILEGNDVSNSMSEEFNLMNSRDKMIFAMLQLAYGIDIEEAENLVKKYGADIDEITPKNEKEENVIKTIQALKIILRCSEQDLEKIYFENKEKINNWEQIDYDSILTLESDCLNLYARLYNEAIQWEETDLEDIEYKGKKVKVQKITSDFNMLLRVEGAYSPDYKEPDNYKEYYEQVNINNNGNCKSSVANNVFARPRPKGPTFGYTAFKENSLYLMAPWDIVSNYANHTYSPAAVKWNFEHGIQFRIPSKNFDNVRHNHDEVVTNKWIYDENTGKLTQELPDFVLYVIDNKEQDFEEDPMWRMSKKAAADLDIPIKIIDLEEVLEKETIKISKLRDKFQNQLILNPENIDLNILERLVVEFENNRVSTRFSSDSLKEKYFTDQERDELYTFIYENIQSIKEVDQNRFFALTKKMQEIIKNEIAKGYSINGKRVVSKSELSYFTDLFAKFNGDRDLINSSLQEKEHKKNKTLKDIYSDYHITQSDIKYLNEHLEERFNKQK